MLSSLQCKHNSIIHHKGRLKEVYQQLSKLNDVVEGMSARLVLLETQIKLMEGTQSVPVSRQGSECP